jgi:hypothetical protein
MSEDQITEFMERELPYDLAPCDCAYMYGINELQNERRLWARKGIEFAQPRWIPVADRLPEDCTRVLACQKQKIYVALIHNGDWMTYDDCRWLPDVTHWLPLPDPPK